ncbi:MAG: PepSY-associated TM helix domain-containing protein [Cellvibrionales bacterium]|nr:PepSY-associated TM helix domain-containing protein [Cellvibrionales bacterium]
MSKANQPQIKSLSPASRKLIRTLKSFHKVIGIFSAVFVILIATTGILINHSQTLSFSKTTVNTSLVLDWYNIKAPADIQVFQDHPVIATSDHQLLMGNQLINLDTQNIKGIIPFIGMYVVAADNTLFLLSLSGEILEKQNQSTGLPSGIKRIGIGHQGVWLDTPSGAYLSNDDLISWTQSTPTNHIKWSHTLTNIDKSTLTQIGDAFRASQLDWEQVILDLHSGRTFGISGVLFNDLIALMLCFLAFSGLFVWYKKR